MFKLKFFSGQLLCCGSPLYLKSRFGPGYYLNIEKDSGKSFKYYLGTTLTSRRILVRVLNINKKRGFIKATIILTMVLELYT